MSDSGGVTLDSVVINIETKAGKSRKNINNLSKALTGLKDSVKGGFSSLNNLSKYLDNLNKSTAKISNIVANVKDMGQITGKLHLLSKVDSPKGVKHAAQYLENLAKASSKVVATSNNLTNVSGIVQSLQTLSNIQKATGLGYAVNKLEGLIKIAPEIGKITKSVADVPQLVKPLQTLSKIESPKGLGAVAKHLNALYNLLEKITPDALLRLTRVSEELAVALTPLADKLASIGNGFSKLQLLADRYGISATRVVSKTANVKQETLDLSKQLNKMNNTLKKTTSIMNNFGSHAIRHFKNLNSKLKQVALSLLGTRSLFTAVRKAISEYSQMDAELAKQTTNLWRALGAQLAPAVEYVLYLFKQLTRIIYSFVYAVTGVDLIARANAKSLASMGKSAKSALGSLQKFDNLNVAEFGDDSDNKLIDLDKIDLSPIQRVIDWVKKLKQEIQDAWNSGNWNGVATVLADGINASFDAINPKIVGSKITSAVTGALSFITTGISNIKWDVIGEKIRETFLAINWSEIWNHAVELFKEAFSGLDDFFDGLFGSNAGGELALSLTGSFFIIKEIIKLTSGEGFLSGLITGGSKLLKTLKQIPLAFSLVGKNTLTTDTISGITGVPKILTKIMVPLTKIAPTLGSIFTKVGALFGGGMGAGAAAVIGGVIVAIMALVKAFKNLWETSEPFRQTINGLIESMKGTFMTVLDAVKGILLQLWDVLKVLWEQVLVPLFNILVSIFEAVLPPLMSILSVLWQNVLAPIIEGLVKILRPILGVIIDVIKSLVVVIGVVVDAINWLWKYVLEPWVKFLLDIVVGTIKSLGLVAEVVIDWIVAAFQWLVDTFALGWSVIKSGFSAAYKFVKDKFVDPLLKAWESIVNGLTKAWENIKNSFKNGINSVIGFLNRMINNVNSKLAINIDNNIAKVLKAIGVNISGGKYQIFTIPTIPKLETGTNEIPYEGLYHLHPGEAVVPKKYNPALGSGTDEEVGQKLDTLISIMGNMNWTNVVNIGNKTIYKEQQRYSKMQNDKYGTTVNL